MTTDTPAQARSTARVAVARLLRSALHAADIDQADLARLCGTSPQKVQRWCDKLERETPYAADIAQMPRAIAMPLLRWAAEQHHALVVDQLEAAGAGDHMGHLHRVMRETADVSVSYVGALEDGVIDAVERERLISEAREAEVALRSVREMLERERGPRVVRGGVA